MAQSPLVRAPLFEPLSGWCLGVLSRLEQAWLPKTSDLETQRRARIIVGSSGLVSVVLSLLIVVNVRIAPQVLAISEALLLVILSVPVLVRRYAALELAGYLLNAAVLVVVAVAADKRGGMLSTTLGWCPVGVVFSALTLPRRGAVLMTLAWAASNYVHALRVDPTHWDSARYGGPLVYALPRALACLVTFGAISIFESARKKAFTQLAAEQAKIRAQRDQIASINGLLEQRHGELQLVLNTIEQGLLVLDQHAVIAPERSRVLSDWFGPLNQGETFMDLLRRCDRRAANQFECGWEFLGEGLVPPEVVLGQLPTRFEHGQRTFDLAFKVLDESASRVLAVISDVTPSIAQAKADTAQRELLQIFRHFSQDRAGVRRFFEDARQLVEAIAAGGAYPQLKRDLHTLKGNAGLFGLGSIANLAHHVEEHLALGDEAAVAERAQLAQAWALIESQMSWLTGADTRQDVARSDLDALQRAVDAGLPHRELASLLCRWNREDVQPRLERLQERAVREAARLGKRIRVDLHSNGVRLDPARWGDFWNAFVHVVTNAVDHGVEAEDERTARGKDAVATLCLEVQEDGEDVLIRARDDGQGIDWNNLATRAMAQGIAAPEAWPPVDLLFAPGLSSREQATESSGRGIGMYAVKDAADALGARIRVESKAGQFTEIEIRARADAAEPGVTFA